MPTKIFRPTPRYLVLWVGPSYETEAIEMDGTPEDKDFLRKERANIEMIYQITGEVGVDELLDTDGEPLGL